MRTLDLRDCRGTSASLKSKQMGNKLFASECFTLALLPVHSNFEYCALIAI